MLRRGGRNQNPPSDDDDDDYGSSAALPDLYRPEILVRESDGNRHSSISTSSDDDAQTNAAQRVLDFCGDLLDQADDALNDDASALGDDTMLASAIQRGCQDLADAVGGLATQLEQQSDEDRQALAQACLQDVQQAQREQKALVQQMRQHDLALNDNGDNNDNEDLLVEWHEFASMDENQLVQVIQAAGSFMRDVEASLRAVDQDEANELADVALTVARIFIASLKSIHAQLTPQDLHDAAHAAAAAVNGDPSSSTSRSASASTVRIELLDEHEDEAEDEDDDAAAAGNRSKGVKNSSPAPPNSSNKSKRTTTKQMDRLRVLWPPLGPAVAKALSWGKDAASQQPFLAVALGMTLWPAAVMTAIVGTPVVLVDGLLQDLYNNLHNDNVPLVVGLERGAAQAYHTSRLALVSGKLVGRHSLKVLQRQVDRRGGVQHILQGVADMALDRVFHPLETIGMACHGIGWSVNQVRGFVQDHVLVHNDEEQYYYEDADERTLQNLQQ